MGADLRALANAIYRLIKDDSDAIATMPTDSAALAVAILAGDGSFELQSSTVNGQTFSGVRSLSQTDKLTIMGMVLDSVDRGFPMPTRSRAYFR